ncbi:MAG: LON peptidase substrate-binding domain-containing protein [Hyphomonadaceae bacterium]|nr:LON peptidase substrate-binding domain-containing protein [Hyphomonadaceae bacterium]
MSAFGYRKPEDLPATIPIFPLAGAVLFPRGTLPLNIFEPRYLNMVDDALAGERLIGMIQPALGEGGPQPALADVGCVGRITSFAETDDGRYLITLTGVSRFRVKRELDLRAPYRKVEPDWQSFSLDLSQRDIGGAIDRDALARALRHYAEARGFQIDWDAASEAPGEMLVNAVCAACPFDVQEKQLLLEADTVADRCDTLVALLELGAAEPPGGATLQ